MTFLHMLPSGIFQKLMAALCTQPSPQLFIRLFRVSPMGGLGESPPDARKIGFLPPMLSPLFCPQNVDFVFFMQFLAILPKLSPSPTSPPYFGNLVVTLLFVSYINKIQ